MPAFTVSHDHELVTVITAEITLAFSHDDGSLRVLRRAAGPNVLGHGEARPAVDVWLDDRGWLAERAFVRYLNHQLEERAGAVEVVIVIGIGPLMVYDHYRITGTLIARHVNVKNVGEDDLQLQGVRLVLPWARVGPLERCQFEAPGNSVRPHVPLGVAAELRPDVPPRRFFAPDLRNGRALEPAPALASGLLALHDPAINEALLCWYYGTAELALPLVEGNGVALTLTHELALAGRMRSEAELSVGTQYMLLLHEAWPAALHALRRTWPLCGVRAPEQPAQWARDAAIFETHPAQFGGFAGLMAVLPELRTLGVNTLCLMPIWEFDNQKERLWDGNWQDSGSPYAVRDFEALDPTLGAPDDLRALVAVAHQHELRVLVELPLQGCASDAAIVQAHPDWFCYDTDGRLAHPPQQPALVIFDWLNSALQTYMLQTALAQLRAYDLDGFRVVVPRIDTPNWLRARQGHASASALAVLQLLAQLRRELRAIKADLALLGELIGPAYLAHQDFALDELAHHMFIHLGLNRITPFELGAWLEDHARALPYDTVAACFVESHQTWQSNPLADGLRGSRISRMLLAGMVMCGFVPLIGFGYQQEERQFIGRLLRARADWSVLRSGTTRYNTVYCSSPQVFAVLREHDGTRMLGLLNASAQKQTVVLTLPIDQLGLREGDYELYELFSRSVWAEDTQRAWPRTQLQALALTLEPFAAHCLVVRPVALLLPAVEPPALVPTVAV